MKLIETIRDTAVDHCLSDAKWVKNKGETWTYYIESKKIKHGKKYKVVIYELADGEKK